MRRAQPASGVGITGLNVLRFRGRLVFEAHRLLFHSTLGLRVIKKNLFESEEVRAMHCRSESNGPRWSEGSRLSPAERARNHPASSDVISRVASTTASLYCAGT